jgi:hypothetical protein
MTYSHEVERRLRELDERGPHGRRLFEHYVHAVERGDRHGKAPPAELSDEELLDGYEGALADSWRYSRPDAIGQYGTSSFSEWNFAISALSAERSLAIKDEILRRMKR